MPRFLTDEDMDLFKSVSQQMMKQVMDTKIVFYKMNVQGTNTNIYGESLNRAFYSGVQIHAVVSHQPQQQLFDWMPETTDSINTKFLMSVLEQFNIYPQLGDVIQFDTQYWEITKVYDEQFIGGNPERSWSVVCDATLVTPTKLQNLVFVNRFSASQRK